MENVFELKVQGKSTRESLASYMEGARRLEPTKVEKGQIFVRTIGSDAISSISLLFLGPKAKIKLHSHPFDSECYGMRDGYNHICPIGSSHSLENTSESHWTMVISTKWKNDAK